MALNDLLWTKNSNVQILHTHVDRHHIAQALNCSVVGLASSLRGESSSSMEIQGRHNCLLDCIGVGFVRAVDATKGLLYLLTDVTPETLEHVDVLQVGLLALPFGCINLLFQETNDSTADFCTALD